MRKTWNKSNKTVLIFVVDSSDRSHVRRAAVELKLLLEEKQLKNCLLLILANKQVWHVVRYAIRKKNVKICNCLKTVGVCNYFVQQLLIIANKSINATKFYTLRRNLSDQYFLKQFQRRTRQTRWPWRKWRNCWESVAWQADVGTFKPPALLKMLASTKVSIGWLRNLKLFCNLNIFAKNHWVVFDRTLELLVIKNNN